MLFSSVKRLEDITANLRANKSKGGASFHDMSHVEIEKHLSSSPTLAIPDSPVSRRNSMEAMEMRWGGAGERGGGAVGGGGREDTEDHRSGREEVGDGRRVDEDHKVKGIGKAALNSFEGGLEFKKLEVRGPGGGEVGGLSLLRLDEGNAGGTEKEKEIPLRIYLPDCSPLDFSIPEDATVDSAIAETLKFWEAQGGGGGGGLVLHSHAPQCYELRLHEGDGEPDEDFPALERGRQVRSFGEEGGEFEYVLCQISGVDVPPKSSISLNFSRSASSATQGKKTVKIYIPSADPGKNAKSFSYTDETTVGDLLKLVMQKVLLGLPMDKGADGNDRFFLLTEVFDLQANEADRKRLKLSSNTLDEKVVLKNLKVEELWLRRREFADDTTTKLDREGKKRPSQMDKDEQPPDFDKFLFDDYNAARYKEFDVIKKNMFGKRQERRMGIDNAKIYNMKRGSNAGLKKVFTAYKLISAVRSIDFVIKEQTGGLFGEMDEEEHFKTFRIIFDDAEKKNKTISWEITAKDKDEASEIIAKIRYLKNKNQKKDVFAELQYLRE